MKQHHAPAAFLAAFLGLAGAANAQSNLALGGQLKVGVDHVSSSGGRVATGPLELGSATRLIDNSSWWFVKGEEDLGAGNKAFFHIENGFSSDSGTQGTGRFHAVGLSNPRYGRILMGVWSIYFASDSMLSPGGLGDAGPYSSGTLNVLGPIGARGRYFSGGFLPNVIRYESPKWGNAAFTAAYAFDTETAGKPSNRTLNFNPTYVGDNVIVYANFLRRNNQPQAPGDFTRTYDQASTRLGVGNQATTGWKVAVLWDRNSVKGSAITGGELSRDAWAIPVSYRTGQHLLKATYGRARAIETGGTTTAATGASMVSVGYEYTLSKRTSLAVNFSQVKNEREASYDFWQASNILAGPAGYRGFTSRHLYFGTKHQF